MDPNPDLDPDPAIFVIDLQHASKKLIFSTIFPDPDPAFFVIDLRDPSKKHIF